MSSPSQPAKQRHRTVIACETCRNRRVRCDGREPCAACTRATLECKYRISSRNVTVSQKEYMELLRDRDYYRKRCEGEQGLAGVPSEPAAGPSIVRPLPSPSASVATTAHAPVSEDVEIEGQGQLLMDESGVSRYMGDISGPVFYTALLQILNGRADQENQYLGPHPQTTYQTWDSRPLPLPPSDPFTLPPRHLAEHLVALFFLNMRDIFPFMEPLASDMKLAYLYESSLLRTETWLLAQFYAILALSSLHIRQPLDPTTMEIPPGIGYLSSAIAIIPTLMESTGPLPAQTLSLVAFYLLAISHRDGAYSSIGSAIQCAVACGMHQLSRGPDANQEAHFTTFWTLVDLDRLICCTLGRPLHLSSSDIATPRPQGVHRSLSVTSDLHARLLQELYHGSSQARRKLYSLPSAKNIVLQCQQSLQEESGQSHATDNPRGRAMRKLALQQVIIIAARPAYLAYLKMRGPVTPQNAINSANTDLRSAFSTIMQELIHAASAAARDMLQTLELLKLTGMLVPWNFFDVHYAYNAGMVFLLERLTGQGSESERNHLERSAEDLLQVLAVTGHDSAASCLSILQTLRHSATKEFQPVDEDFWRIFGVAGEPTAPTQDLTMGFPASNGLPDTLVDSDLDALLQSIGVTWNTT